MLPYTQSAHAVPSCSEYSRPGAYTHYSITFDHQQGLASPLLSSSCVLSTGNFIRNHPGYTGRTKTGLATATVAGEPVTTTRPEKGGGKSKHSQFAASIWGVGCGFFFVCVFHSRFVFSKSMNKAVVDVHVCDKASNESQTPIQLAPLREVRTK